MKFLDEKNPKRCYLLDKFGKHKWVKVGKEEPTTTS
jgi:hypothetical protein